MNTTHQTQRVIETQAENTDNKKMHPSREVGRFDNGELLVATG